MVAVTPNVASWPLRNARLRGVLAARRAEMARASLANCHLCAHHCGVNRLAGAAGKCRAGADARVFSAQVEVSDELSLAPTFAVAFGGCDLRCGFCITGRESWNAKSGEAIDFAGLAESATQALAAGARSIMLLGGEPTIFLPDALMLVARLPESATLVWKTNAHGSRSARSWLEGIFDVWVADFKFGNDACATRLAGVENYLAVVHENLAWAAREQRVILRHLLMPGHVECCWRPIAEWVARTMPHVEVSLRDGFWPAWQSRRFAELTGPCGAAEVSRARAIAADCSLRLVA